MLSLCYHGWAGGQGGRGCRGVAFGGNRPLRIAKRNSETHLTAGIPLAASRTLKESLLNPYHPEGSPLNVTLVVSLRNPLGLQLAYLWYTNSI